VSRKKSRQYIPLTLVFGWLLNGNSTFPKKGQKKRISIAKKDDIKIGCKDLEQEEANPNCKDPKKTLLRYTLGDTISQRSLVIDDPMMTDVSKNLADEEEPSSRC